MAAVDVSVSRVVSAPPDRVRAVMFDPTRDPDWMAAVKAVERLDGETGPGARVRRVGRFLGRTLRWTTEVIEVGSRSLRLRIVDGPMRGTVDYTIEPAASGSRVTIRNVGDAPAFAPGWLLRAAMRRSLEADLRRLQRLVEPAP